MLSLSLGHCYRFALRMLASYSCRPARVLHGPDRTAVLTMRACACSLTSPSLTTLSGSSWCV